MLVRALVLAVVLAPLAAGGQAGDEAVKEELKQLQGDWKAIKGEADNNAFTGGDPIIIEGDKLSLVIRDRIAFVGKIKINPKASPKTIDWELTEGPGGVVGKIKPGIYKLEKDKLEICWNPEGSKERPKRFTTKLVAGRGFLYTLYERKKD
jgi:uncharacterized protein (TIGR03067 family)